MQTGAPLMELISFKSRSGNIGNHSGNIWSHAGNIWHHSGNIGTIQGTFGNIQGTFGTIQGTFGTIQGTFGTIQGTFGIYGESDISAYPRVHIHAPSSINPFWPYHIYARHHHIKHACAGIIDCFTHLRVLFGTHYTAGSLSAHHMVAL
jgi:aggrecan 1